MAKFKKFLCIIALAVFSLTFLVGCGLFVLNEDRYRAQEALNIGGESISLGEVIDYFDANGTVYLNQGYTTQQVWDMLYPAFVQQKVMLVEYKENNRASNTSDLAKAIGGNASYLDDDTLEYIQKSVYLSFYQSLDSLTTSNLEEDFTFEAAEEETDYPEMINRGQNWTPEQEDAYLDIDALDKELAKSYVAQDYKTIKYVFAETDKIVIDTVADLNERLVKDSDEDDDVTVADYIKAQNSAISTTTKNVKNNKGVTLQEYIDDMVKKQVDAQITNKYLADIYGDNQDKITQDMFEARLANLKAQAEATYSQNLGAFESFITGLTDDDLVYYVPEQYQGEYYYVRSILLPFSDEQTELLNKAKSRYGATSQQYVDFRKSLIEQIEVKDNEGNTKAYSAVYEEMAQAFENSADGVATFLDFTYKYNTDPGMQNPVHSYVVSKDSTDLDYAGTNFVKEFVDKAREMINAYEAGNDQMFFVVTDYGVHAMIVDDVVEADTITWADRNNYGIEGGSASWRFYQDMYLELKDLFADDAIADLYNSYKDDGKIQVNSDVIKSYADSIGVTFAE